MAFAFQQEPICGRRCVKGEIAFDFQQDPIGGQSKLGLIIVEST
jgi:hypothetical protein